MWMGTAQLEGKLERQVNQGSLGFIHEFLFLGLFKLSKLGNYDLANHN
jgi:hypothetical protein